MKDVFVLLLGTALFFCLHSTQAVPVKELPGEIPVTAACLTENGEYLLIAHRQNDLISIWDVRNEKTIKTVKCSSPSYIICRNAKVFVASFLGGTINIYSLPPEFTLDDQIEVKIEGIEYLSAPANKYFKGELIGIGCGKLVHIDINKEDSRILSNDTRSAWTFSCDGASLIEQWFGQKSYVKTVTFNYRNFLAGDRKGQDITPVTALVGQARDDSIWYSGSDFYVGNSFDKTRLDGLAVVPDEKAPLAYLLKKNEVEVYKAVPGEISKISSFPIEYPIELDYNLLSYDKSRQKDDGKSNRPYNYFRSAHATTLDGKHYLFLSSPYLDRIYYAMSTSISTPGNDDLDVRKDVPDRMQVGENLRVYLTGKEENGEYTLLKGPKNAKVSSNGLLEWSPKADNIGSNTFKIRVRIADETSFRRFSVDVLAKQPDLSPQAVKAPSEIVLNNDGVFLDYGSNYDRFFVLNGDRLMVFSSDCRYLLAEHTLEETYSKLKDRGKYLLLLGQDYIDLYDSTNFRKTKRIQLKCNRAFDMAPHPLQNKTYVAVFNDLGGKLSSIEAKQVMEVNEASGEVSPVINVLGEMLAIDPGGRYLYSALKDWQQTGYRIHIGFGIVEPTYGYLDLLMSYYITDDGLVPFQSNIKPGKNGSKIAMSPDGANVAYVSEGYIKAGNRNPSSTVPSFKAGDVRYTDTEYDIAATTHAGIRYHPRLDIVVCHTDSNIFFFERGSGKPLPDLAMIKDPRGLGNIKDVFFAPSGTELVIVCSRIGDRFSRLIFAPLNISDVEKRAIAAKSAKPPTPPPLDVADIKLPEPIVRKAMPFLTEYQLRQFMTPDNAKLTPTDINEKHRDAVVIISCGQKSGTGFFISKTGHVMTCAHVLSMVNEDDGKNKPEPDVLPITVIYYSGDTRQSVKAYPLFIDTARDLAILKIDADLSVNYLKLETRRPLKTGNDVYVLGHPGVGDGQILEYTMTQGIVSNANRMIGSISYVQTTAAINPGCSGGPLFNAYGNIVGLVVLKANIEGAGFALPAEQIKSCLDMAKKMTDKLKRKTPK